MGSPSPMPSPSPYASTTPSNPNSTPTPDPQPNYPPVPDLPNLPSNGYQLLLNLSSAIDTASGSLSAVAENLASTQRTTNTAVGGIVANSQGEVTDGLNDIWSYTQQDFANAGVPLLSITGAGALGGSPNQLQEVLDQHRADFLNGIPAIEQLQHLQATNFASSPSVEEVQNLVDLAQAVIDAMGNVNTALWMMITAIDTINFGISLACATGLEPGTPPPLFSPTTFSMESNGSAGGSGKNKMSADQLQQYLEDQGVDSETALDIALFAEEQGLSLSDIQQMFDSQIQSGMSDPELASASIQQLINDGELGKWYNSGKSGHSLSEVTALLNASFDTDAINTLLKNNADIPTTLTSAQDLLNRQVSMGQINQWAADGQNLKGILALEQKGITTDNINKGLAQPVTKGWASINNATRQNMVQTIKNWKNGVQGRNSRGSINDNDGTHYQNRNGKLPGGPDRPLNGKIEPRDGYVNPRGYTEYTVNNVGTNTNSGNKMRIVVDKYGNMWYSPDHYDDWVSVPQSFIIQALS